MYFIYLFCQVYLVFLAVVGSLHTSSSPAAHDPLSALAPRSCPPSFLTPCRHRSTPSDVTHGVHLRRSSLPSHLSPVSPTPGGCHHLLSTLRFVSSSVPPPHSHSYSMSLVKCRRSIYFIFFLALPDHTIMCDGRVRI